MERIFTIEFDSPGDHSGVLATRHAECAARTDVGHCEVLERPPDDPPQDNECWGCDGWLHEPPLTVEQTARLRAAREAAEAEDDARRPEGRS